MKSKSSLIIAGALLLSGVVSGYWFYMVPRSNPELEADLAALRTMGVPTTEKELEALRQKGTPDAAKLYATAAFQFELDVGAISNANPDELLSLQPGMSVSDTHLKIVDSMEPVWHLLQKGVQQDSFFPDRPLIDWEMGAMGPLVNSHQGLTTFLAMRASAATSRGDSGRAYETVALSLEVGEQIGDFPGLVTSYLGRMWMDHGFRMAGQLGRAFPNDKALNEKLVALIETSPTPELRKAYMLQPAIAFTILDSKKRIPAPYAPNSHQIALPAPAKTLLAEGRRAREGAKEILADYYRNLLENCPDDASDTRALFNLIQDERLDPRTFEGELASKLAIPTWRLDSNGPRNKTRQEVLAILRANLSK